MRRDGLSRQGDGPVGYLPSADTCGLDGPEPPPRRGGGPMAVCFGDLRSGELAVEDERFLALGFGQVPLGVAQAQGTDEAAVFRHLVAALISGRSMKSWAKPIQQEPMPLAWAASMMLAVHRVPS